MPDMGREKRIRSGLLAGVCLVMLLVSPAAATEVSRSFSEREADSAKRYWTEERLAEALRRDPAFGRVPEPDAIGSELRHRPVRVSRPEVGKIIGRSDFGPYSCSGAVIDTASLRLVLTAAHCLYAEGSWGRRIVFIPDFRRGKRPRGTYRSTAAWVPDQWFRRSYGAFGANFDIGILVTRRTANGSRIGENVGALPVRFHPRHRGLTDIYGYPAGAMRGQAMRTCRAHTQPNRLYNVLPGPVGMVARCNMAGGSSGGPWISRYRAEGGGTVGVVDGLTSTGFPRGGRSYLASPYFGRILVSLINSAEGRGR